MTRTAFPRTFSAMDARPSDSQLLKDWGDRVLYTVLARGYDSMTAFAEQLGYQGPTVNKWKRGGGTTIPQIVRIAMRLRVTTDFLLTGAIDGMVHGDLMTIVTGMQRDIRGAKARPRITRDAVARLWPRLESNGILDDWPDNPQ